jgi:hypothetical protein
MLRQHLARAISSGNVVMARDRPGRASERLHEEWPALWYSRLYLYRNKSAGRLSQLYHDGEGNIPSAVKRKNEEDHRDNQPSSNDTCKRTYTWSELYSEEGSLGIYVAMHVGFQGPAVMDRVVCEP